MFPECSNMQLGFKISSDTFYETTGDTVISPLIDLLHHQAEAGPTLMLQNSSAHHAAHKILNTK